MTPKRRAWLRAASLVAGLAVIATLAWFADPARILDAVRRVTLPALLFACALYVVAWSLRAARWRSLLGATGGGERNAPQLPYGRAVGLTIAGNAANVVLPAKLGDAIRAVAASRLAKLPIERALAAGVADRALDLTAVALLTLLAIALHPVGLSRSFLLPAGLVLAAGAIAAVAGLLYVRARDGASGRFERVERFLRALAEAGADAARRPARTAVLLAASLAVWTLETAIAFTISRAIGLDVAPAAILLAVMLANMAKAVPLTPSGLGTYELAFTEALVVSGVEPSLAATAAILDHGLKNALTLAGGGVSWLLLGPARATEPRAPAPHS